MDRLVLAEHLAGGDAKQEGVSDLASGAGHGDSNRGLHREISFVCAFLGRSARDFAAIWPSDGRCRTLPVASGAAAREVGWAPDLLRCIMALLDVHVNIVLYLI
jgi:hypothetical protein